MSKFATVAVVALLISVVASMKTFEIINYPNPGCTGKGVVSNVPVDTCFPAHYQNYSMMDFSISTADSTWAVIYPDATGHHCATKGMQTAVECGKCLNSGVPGVEYYRYDCNSKTKTVHAKDQCDSSCSTCGHSATFTVGGCHKYNNGTKQIYLDSIVKDKVLHENLYFGSKCSGAGQKVDLRCGACYGAALFNCTTVGEHGIEKVPKGIDFLAKALI